MVMCRPSSLLRWQKRLTICWQTPHLMRESKLKGREMEEPWYFASIRAAQCRVLLTMRSSKAHYLLLSRYARAMSSNTSLLSSMTVRQTWSKLERTMLSMKRELTRAKLGAVLASEHALNGSASLSMQTLARSEIWPLSSSRMDRTVTETWLQRNSMRFKPTWDTWRSLIVS